MPREQLQLILQRILVDPGTPPKPAHKFMYHRVGSDIVLEVAYFDLNELRIAIEEGKEQKEKKEKPRVPLYVTDRFTLSVQAALDLRDAANALVADLEEIGMFTPESEGKKGK